MKRMLLGGLILLGLASASTSAETNAPRPAITRKPADRYLLIFDTSAAMKPRAKAVEETVAELITSGMHGQLQPGDTIGVWTFNETLYTGQLPLQTWQPALSNQIATRIVEFLKAQKYQKKANFNLVAPALSYVVSNSYRLTVILFSDCTTPLNGTPFDAELNTLYAQYRQAMKRYAVPFVTVFRAQKGRFLAATGTMALWPIEFPPFPPEHQIAKAGPTNEPTPLDSVPAQAEKRTQRQQPKLARPIVLHGTNSGQRATGTAEQPDTEPTKPRPQIVTAPTATNPIPYRAADRAPHEAEVTTAPELTSRAGSADHKDLVPPLAPMQPQLQPATAGPEPISATAKPRTPQAEPGATPQTQQQRAFEDYAARPAGAPGKPSEPLQPAAALPLARKQIDWLGIGVASVGFAAGVITLIAMFVRGHRRPKASLITRSLEHEIRPKP